MDGAFFFSVLLPIAVVQTVGWATPGANHLTIITASVTAGRRAGLRAGMGIVAGAVTWALIAVSGIAVIFELFPSTYTAIRSIGAAYLFYLGIGAFRSLRGGGVFELEAKEGSAATRAPFRTGYLVMLTNPKAVLFFGSIFTAFIPVDGSAAGMAAIVAQTTILSVILNTIAALFFSHPPVMRAFQSSGRIMSFLVGVLFCGLGALVAWDVVQGML